MIYGCIALGWLGISMLLHKEIDRLRFSTYPWLPHFQLALVIDHHLHLHYYYYYYSLLLLLLFIFTSIRIVDVI